MNELIQWPRAKYWTKAWNPMIGCQPCSPACEHCYARTWAGRFGLAFTPHETGRKSPPKKGVVFCGNMTDLWGDWTKVHEGRGWYYRACDYIAEAIDHDKANPYKNKATYLWLTKRVGNLCETLSDFGFGIGWDYWEQCDYDVVDFEDCDLSNHFFGFTAENQAMYAERYSEWVPNFPKWANGWISAEPLLGPLELCFGTNSDGIPPPGSIKWVVVGCESGAERRPCRLEWVEGIVSECLRAEVPVFVKQLDLGGKCVTDISKFPEHLRIRQVPWTVPTERPRQDKE